MERTPEEIKAGLECCIKACDCDNNCPYMPEINCTLAQRQDALAYIRQLETREWDLFDLLSSAWFGKRCYFQQDDGNVYSRLSGEDMSFDQAIDELAHELTYDRECEQSGKGINVPRWISAEERLPEISDVVLVIANGNPRANVELRDAILIASYWGDEGWIAEGYEEWDAVNVSYWQQLPEPPEVVEL